MPKVYTVEKAFLSTGEDKKTPQVVTTKNGEMHKYMVQLVDQEIPGWIGILKKPGNAVAEGDEMYGVLEKNDWGKPQFTRMQTPDGVRLKTSSAPASTPSEAPTEQDKPASTGGSVEAKLDYMIGLLENFLGAKETAKPDFTAEISNGPADLSKIEY